MSVIRSVLESPGLDRLGLVRLFGDHNATLYKLNRKSERSVRVADLLVLWGIPASLAIAAVAFGWHLQSTGPILNGVAIISGGLFGFLVLILGVQTLGSTSPRLAPVRDLVRETRANTAYATAWALVIAVALMIVESFRADPSSEYASWATGLVLAAVVHLALVLLMVLNRVRLVFANLS